MIVGRVTGERLAATEDRKGGGLKYQIHRDVGRLNAVPDVLVAHRGGFEFRMDGYLDGHRPVEVDLAAARIIAKQIGDCRVVKTTRR